MGGLSKRRALIIICTIVLLVLPLSQVWGESYDFRKISWWMSRAEVKKSEISEMFLLEDDEMMAYAVEIINMDAFLVYYFTSDNKVWGSSILFRGEYEDKDLYLNDFNYVKKMMVQKYGEPIIDDVSWAKEKPGKESGVQVMLGNLRYSTFWTTETTLINLILEGENNQILISIDYSDLEYYLDGLLSELDNTGHNTDDL